MHVLQHFTESSRCRNPEGKLAGKSKRSWCDLPVCSLTAKISDSRLEQHRTATLCGCKEKNADSDYTHRVL